MTKYSEAASSFQKQITNDINKIYKNNSNILKLELANTNVLSKDSSVNGSTALGFILEEFIIQNLLKMKPNIYSRADAKTNNGSYDLLAKEKNIKILINLKVNKVGTSQNNAISALTKLIIDYCDDSEEKLFLIFKTYYRVEDFIEVVTTKSYYLEQILWKNIKQDNRKWSDAATGLNGRIQYNYKKGLNDINTISYKDTVKNIYNFRDSILSKNK